MNSIIKVKNMIRSAAMELRLSIELLLVRLIKYKIISLYRNKKKEFLSELKTTYRSKRNQWIIDISRFEF